MQTSGRTHATQDGMTTKGRSAVWVYPPPADCSAVQQLVERQKIPWTMAEIICRRFGERLADDEVDALLHPAFRDLHDPYLYTDMERAAKRIAEAVRDREPVVVYGDYDVDGTTATALIVEALETLGVKAEWRIPHRTTDGYGLSDRGANLIRQCAGSLVIVLDCGVTAVEQIKALTDEGRDVIVVDHHEPGPQLPDALAVLDAKRPGDSYPFGGLSAVGVAFKLLQALCDVLGAPQSMLLLPGLDLVAVGTAADIVPILDENRILMRHGLRRLKRNPRAGLRALMNVARLTGRKLTTSSIVFGIAPRINAAGRMESADLAVRLLLCRDVREATTLALELNRLNRRRQLLDQEVLDAARAEAEVEVKAGARALVLAHEEWHPGIIGIVASRLVEEFCVPTVLISAQAPLARGSGRSIDGFDIHSALKACGQTLVEFGGHVRAVGLTIEPGRIPEFREILQRIANELVTDDMLSPRVHVDAEVDLRDVNVELVAALEKLGPFGPGNMRPVLVSRGLRAIADPVILKEAHLKAEVEQEGAVREIIGFDLAWAAPLFDSPVDIAYVAEEERWQGRSRLQLRVKAIRPSEGKKADRRPRSPCPT